MENQNETLKGANTFDIGSESSSESSLTILHPSDIRDTIAQARSALETELTGTPAESFSKHVESALPNLLADHLLWLWSGCTAVRRVSRVVLPNGGMVLPCDYLLFHLLCCEEGALRTDEFPASVGERRKGVAF